ncbi:MAG: TlpA family protein disulfide reductase [Bacteroidota bacterium]
MKRLKIGRRQIKDILWLLSIALIVFTPLGFQLKVQLTRILAFSPSITSVEERTVLQDFNWHLKSTDGSRFSLASVKGKVVVINFWATWCPPCIAEMPSLNALYKSYNEEVVFIFIAQDKPDRVTEYLEKQGYNLPVYFAQHTPPNLLQHTSIPTTYILSKEGEIIVQETGAADWNSKNTRALLSELLQG